MKNVESYVISCCRDDLFYLNHRGSSDDKITRHELYRIEDWSNRPLTGNYVFEQVAAEPDFMINGVFTVQMASDKLQNRVAKIKEKMARKGKIKEFNWPAISPDQEEIPHFYVVPLETVAQVLLHQGMGVRCAGGLNHSIYRLLVPVIESEDTAKGKVFFRRFATFAI